MDNLEPSSHPEEDERETAAALTAWPLCPECGQPRATMCPYCGTAGSDFPRADSNFLATVETDEQGREPLAVICPSCDEPWVPEFFRRCEWCSHDFGSGIDRDPAHPVPASEEFLNPRAALVMWSIFLITLALLAYFALIVAS